MVAAAAAATSGHGEFLHLDHVVKDFSVTSGAVLQRRIGQVSAVADVSFALPPGSTFGLVGESGCGKTTIGRLIVGLEKPTSGRILLDGEDIAQSSRGDRRRRARAAQLMFQDSYASMDPRMRVSTILREPLAIARDGSRAEQRRRIAAILNEVGLPATAVDRYPHEFSGGQRQRLGLARALIAGPSLIVADEPVSALDVSIQAQILNLMRDLQREHGLTYLFISHDLSVVRYMADAIGVMYLGKLVETGPAAAVYSSPAHPYTQGLIDTVPVADPEAERAKEHQGVRGELPSAINPPTGCRFRTRCPRAQELCAATEPPLRAFTSAAHQAACHFPLRGPDPGLLSVTEETGPSSPAWPALLDGQLPGKPSASHRTFSACTAASRPDGSGPGCCAAASPAPSPAALPFLLRMHQADRTAAAGCAELHHGKARDRLFEGAFDSGAPAYLPDVETPGSDDGDRSHAGVDDDLDIPVIELGFGQVNGHGAHARADPGETADLPAALEANVAHRGEDLQRLLAPPCGRSECDGGRQAANHGGEVGMSAGPQQPIEGCLKAVQVDPAAGQELPQDVDPALPQVLGDRRLGLGWDPVVVHASTIAPDPPPL